MRGITLTLSGCDFGNLEGRKADACLLCESRTDCRIKIVYQHLPPNSNQAKLLISIVTLRYGII